MSGRLDSAWSKWVRARDHSERLTRELAGSEPRFAWAYNYPVTFEAQPSGLEYRFYVEAGTFDGARHALVVGDLIFDLRCALDHMIYAMHLRRYRGNIPERIQFRTQFPIYSRRPEYQKGAKKGTFKPPTDWPEICNLSKRHVAAIAFLQPYDKRKDDLAWIREGLGLLAALNNIDKHRHLHVVRMNSVAAPVPWFGGGTEPFEEDPLYGFRQRSFFVPLEGKTEVFRWTFKRLPPDIASHLQRNREITAGISLDEEGQKTMLLPLVEGLVKVVAAVLNRLAPLVA